MKPTKGPWRVWAEKPRKGYCPPSHCWICEPERSSRHSHFCQVSLLWPEGMANARAISKVPEMLELLQEAVLDGSPLAEKILKLVTYIETGEVME